MKNFVQNGCNVDVTAPYAVASGGGVLVGALFGVAVTDIANGEVGAIATEGVYDLTAATGNGTNAALGAKAYWDNSAKKVTPVETNNAFIGHFLAAKAVGDSTARVRLFC